MSLEKPCGKIGKTQGNLGTKSFGEAWIAWQMESAERTKTKSKCMKKEIESLASQLDRIDGGLAVLAEIRSATLRLLIERIEKYKKLCCFDSASESAKVCWREIEAQITLGAEALLLVRLHESSLTLQDFATTVVRFNGSVARALEALKLTVLKTPPLSRN